MPSRPGAAVLIRTSAWDHPASSLPALVASHAFNHSLAFITPISGDSGCALSEAAADALAPPPPPLFYALRASPAAFASPEFAAWAFPDTYGVVEEKNTAAEPDDTPMEVDGGGPPRRRPRRRPAFQVPARGAAALAVPGCLDAAGAAALLPRGRLLLTVPALTFRRLGVPGVRLATPGGGGGGAGSLGRARTGTGGGRTNSTAGGNGDASGAAWYAVDTPITGTRRAATPGGPRAKAADRLGGSAGVLDWLLVGPPPPGGRPGAPAAAGLSTPPPPHIPGLHLVAPVEAKLTRTTLPTTRPPAWEAVFYGGRVPDGGGESGGGGGGGRAPAATAAPDPAAAVAALDWVGAVVAGAGGLVMGEGGGGPDEPPPPPLDFGRGRRGGAHAADGATTAAAPTAALRATTWTGFLPPAFVEAALAAARAAVGARTLPWAAVAVAGFPHTPEAWAPRPDCGDGRGANPAQPGIRAGVGGRGSGFIVVALPGGRYGVLAASAGPDGLRAL